MPHTQSPYDPPPRSLTISLLLDEPGNGGGNVNDIDIRISIVKTSLLTLENTNGFSWRLLFMFRYNIANKFSLNIIKEVIALLVVTHKVRVRTL